MNEAKGHLWKSCFVVSLYIALVTFYQDFMWEPTTFSKLGPWYVFAVRIATQPYQ